jgi:hypothetical protein
MKKVIILVILFITACTESSSKGSILDNSSCDLPCWNDIIAGKTTQSELLYILEKLPDVDQKSIQNMDQPWSIFDNQIYFTFRQGWSLNQRSKIRGYVHITHSTVSDIIICGELNTTIGEITMQAGEPEGIISGNDIDGGRTVIFINSQKGVSFWYTTDEKLHDQQFELTPNTQIDCLRLFDPSLYAKMLDAKLISGGHYNAEETLKVMYPWNGYGNLELKYPPRQP